MDFIFKNVIFIIILSSIFSYITFPLNHDDYNLSITDSPKETFEKLIKSKIYLLVNMGSEKVNVKSYINLNRAEFMIAGKSMKYHKYNEFNSSSFECIHSHCEIKQLYYGWYTQGIKSTENFYILTDKNETKLFNGIKFVLGIKESLSNPGAEGFVGLQLPYYDSMVDYNLIVSLKKANVTNSYYWFFNFNDAKMVIDGFPHDLDNKKYSPKKYVEINTVNDGYYKIWALVFTNVYYNNENINLTDKESITSSFQFEKNFIVAPNKTFNVLKEHFFKDYFDKNICFRENLEQINKNFIYCKDIKEFDIKKFKSIFFKNIGLKCIFELNYEDLFYFKNNFVFFLILFGDETWEFGNNFLKKYFLVFNQDKHTIGYYENYESKNKTDGGEKKSNNIFTLTHLFLLLILIAIIFVGIIVIICFIRNKQRKIRANELKDDNYEYNAIINENEK